MVDASHPKIYDYKSEPSLKDLWRWTKRLVNDSY